MTNKVEAKDFSNFVAYFRSIDITEYLGGDRKGDPQRRGQHLQWLTIVIIFIVFSSVFWLCFYCIEKRLLNPKY